MGIPMSLFLRDQIKEQLAEKAATPYKYKVFTRNKQGNVELFW